MSLSLRRMIGPLIFGLGGAAILVNLGLWQLSRLEWKTALINTESARMSAPPVSLPATLDPLKDHFLHVEITGTLGAEMADVLTSIPQVGPGYKMIAALETPQGRRVLVDLGFILEENRAAPRPSGSVSVTGNVFWPNETDWFTPQMDQTRNIWFARDLDLMSAALQTEPVMIVARTITPPVANLYLRPSDRPNNHLNYAITWFSLAFVWLGMTGLLLWRIRR
jgi:surfeit locus 1 family protein